MTIANDAAVAPRARESEAVDSAVAMMDEASFLTFYRRTAAPLRAYVARVLDDVSQADDIVQEAYLRVLRTPPHTEDPPQLRAFVFRVATNLIVDHWRKRRRERAAPDESIAAAPGPDMPLRIDMARLFARLRPQHRQLLWLAYVEGADHREIAVTLGVGERSVRVLLHRARRTLARLLQGSGHGPFSRRATTDPEPRGER